jgi:DNA-directed RNA polymerase subunit M/transcription elongation factor TFIIS
MNFCPKCRFMLYTKRELENQEEKTSIDTKYILKNYCRNCSWEGLYNNQDEKITVYKKNYTNEFLTEKSLISQYTINDPTLPRISNIKCVNDSCLTNLGNSTYLIKIKKDEHHLIAEVGYEKIIELDNVNIVIDLQPGEEIESLKENESFTGTIEEYQKPNREIIFMKYDPINLKYIYICSTCNTTWKND